MSGKESKALKDVSKTNKWDIRLGDWQTFQDNQLLDFSTILFKEQNIFIIREFKLFNRQTFGNRYLIKNNLANNLFYGIEENSCFSRFCIFYERRGFDMTFYDKNGFPSFRLYRPFRIGCCGLIPGCKQKITIKDNSNKIIGEVTQKVNFCRFSLKLYSKEIQLEIVSPGCEAKISFCMSDMCFNIYEKTNNTICGHICKLSEFSCGGHIFRLQFGKDWSPEIKSIVIGATILIDYNFFDDSYHENKYHRVLVSSAPNTLATFPLIGRYQTNTETQ